MYLLGTKLMSRVFLRDQIASLIKKIMSDTKHILCIINASEF